MVSTATIQLCQFSSVQFSRSVVSDCLWPHESQHARPPCPSPSPGFWYPIILPFHTVHGVLKARLLKWLAIPFSSGPHSVRPLHHDPTVLGCPAGMAWFHWVRQGCGPSVIRLTSFLWVWFQCVCPLMPSCNTYHLTWVSLTLAWGISSSYVILCNPLSVSLSHTHIHTLWSILGTLKNDKCLWGCISGMFLSIVFPL